MGLFDQLAGSITSSIGGGGTDSSLVSNLLESLHGQSGGLGALTERFGQAGLSHVLGSWIGTGQNLPISPDQVRTVLGDDTVAHLAEKSGTSPDDTASRLSTLLPTVVDKLSPNGALPEGGLGLLQKGLGFLGGGS